MSTAIEHKEKYQHNKEFIEFLHKNDKDEFIDWKIVGCFYASLHLIQSLLHSKKGIEDTEMENHVDTKNIIKKNYPSLLSYYILLLTLSKTARYQSVRSLCSNDGNKAEDCLQGIVDECKLIEKSK